MSLFDPVTRSPSPKPSTSAGPVAERGDRPVLAPAVPDAGAREPRRRVHKNDRLEKGPRGVLVGDPKTGFYDLDGHYCRRRGRKVIVERFGPKRALQQLTEAERKQVMNARRRYKSRNPTETR